MRGRLQLGAVRSDAVLHWFRSTTGFCAVACLISDRVDVPVRFRLWDVRRVSDTATVDWFTFAILVLAGFTACAEFGSYAFVHPITRRLPQREFIAVEQGLLTSFGRVMPILMPLTLVVAIAYAIGVWDEGGWIAGLATAAAISFAAAVISTVVVNVPINLQTGKWDPADPPADWKQTRARWELFQGIRSWLLLAGFVLICACVAVRLDG